MTPADQEGEARCASFAMLGDVRVLDLTSSIAGPYATMLLADLGAEVIKVETPAGDDARRWGPPFVDGDSLWFHAVNRGKRSVVVDLGDPAMRAALDDLIAGADVFVTNQIVGQQAKLGIDAKTLRGRHPGLVHVSLTGFGLDGPYANRACYDLIAEGYSGVMDLTGTPDAAPQKVGAPAADKLAGADAAMAVLAALHRRARSGEGATIDVSLTESMIRFLSPRVVSYLGSGEVPRRSGGTDSVIAIYQAFETATDPLTLALGNDAIWGRFWDALGEKPDFGAGVEVGDNRARRAARAVIVRTIQAILLRRPRSEWLDLFAAHRIPAGPIYRVDEMARDEHFRERGLIYDLTRNGVAIPQIGLGIHIDGRTAGGGAPPPRLGEHQPRWRTERDDL